jgi:hypothetical protein
VDLERGQIKVAKRLQGFDTSTVVSLLPSGPNPNCPVPNTPDFDLGGARPNLVGNLVGNIVAFGQKSGI